MLLHPRDGAPNIDGVKAPVLTPEERATGTLESSRSDIDWSRDAVELAMGTGDAQRVGRFRFYVDGQRWEWSENVERLHGYEPGTVTPTTELLLSHKHPDDRPQVAAVLEKVADGEPFSSRHRIIDTAGRTHWVIVIGDRMLDDAGKVIGTSGFYVDYTDTMQSDISAAVSKVAEARAEIEQAKGLLMAAYGISETGRSTSSSGARRKPMSRSAISPAASSLRWQVLTAGTRMQVDHALLNIS